MASVTSNLQLNCKLRQTPRCRMRAALSEKRVPMAVSTLKEVLPYRDGHGCPIKIEVPYALRALLVRQVQ